LFNGSAEIISESVIVVGSQRTVNPCKGELDIKDFIGIVVIDLLIPQANNSSLRFRQGEGQNFEISYTNGDGQMDAWRRKKITIK
jgi:hypothetical protein